MRASWKGNDMTVEHITPANGNIFEDLDLLGADDLLYKASLVAIIHRAITSDGLSQRKAADLIGISQPKLSNLLRGRFEGVSLQKLADCIAELGHDIEMRILPRHAGTTGKIRVLEEA
jgi:predicted XRE-type DNA-binding protein